MGAENGHAAMQPTLRRVPDLVGLPLERAQMVLESSGFSVGEILYKDSYEDKDTVVEHAPRRGQVINGSDGITLWVARRGCIEHLPAIFRRTDPLGRNLVRDLCFLFDHMFGSVEAKIDQGYRYFNPHECPPDFLPWLASWTALAVDNDWGEAKKRSLIRHAVDLYRLRGTKRGLALFLKLFTGEEPTIEEHTYPIRGIRAGDGTTRIGVDSVVLQPPNLAHCFVVTLPVADEDITPEFVIRIHRIIQMERPAHTSYYLRFSNEQGDKPLQEFFTIGINARIGVSGPAEQTAESKPEPQRETASAEAEDKTSTTTASAKRSTKSTADKTTTKKRATTKSRSRAKTSADEKKKPKTTRTKTKKTDK